MSVYEANCTCTLETGCGEGNDGGCNSCRGDCYEPCPVFGFMCTPECGDPDECCTDEQRDMTRKYLAKLAGGES